jgi:hypothetical protein
MKHKARNSMIGQALSMSAQRRIMHRSLEQIIKQFYERFKEEQRTFQQFLQQGAPTLTTAEQEQFTALLLNRLMLLYFMQSKGLFDNNPHYLTDHLHLAPQYAPTTFYRLFLLPLFARLNTPPCEKSTAPADKRATVPYLSGTLFSLHEIERCHPELDIANNAFTRLFAFFDRYHWCLEEPTELLPDTLTPNVLGHIFEQYVNQKHMGAYYTRDDATTYITNYTIIPYYLEALQRAQPALFSSESCCWQLLRSEPDRYIQASVRTPDYLPGETPHDYTQRHTYYHELYTRLRSGEMLNLDDLITYNLDITRFACDLLANLNDCALLQTCYEELTRVTILDPTCGSGAFLMAALQTLLPLYETCLARLHATQQASSNSTQEPPANQRLRYTIIKTIITNNLYGVDIMAEAIEICKLRLSLKLIAQAVTSSELAILPNLARTIRAGNALLPLAETPPTHGSGGETFNWYTAFPEVFMRGGFSVIVGNPPYVEHNSRSFTYSLQHFATYRCTNLYTCVVERSHQLLAPHGRDSMILPLAAFATRNMQRFLSLFRQWFPVSWLSFYHFRPSMLFSGGKIASIPTAIYLGKTTGGEQRFSTHLLKWTYEQRSHLFALLRYNKITAPLDPHNQHYYPKFGHPYEDTILRKILAHQTVRTYLATIPNQNTMYYRSAGGLYWKIFVNFPWPYYTTSNKRCSFREEYDRDVFVALFNSSLFWWYYTVTFDTFNLKDYMLFGFRFSYPTDEQLIQQLRACSQLLMDDFRRYGKHLKRGQTGSYTIYARKSKHIIDSIDTLLAQHYGINAEELNFILTYDQKYRMGPTIQPGR